ncbi:MAG TPA: LytTR family DNA-binding domain-containing protein [Chitinophagaceae bacterium]|nr:LytTR family DNA-binding domain-containing protein [Chitinophagaceae bacterium]
MHELRKIRCLVVDDEPPAREVLRRYVEQLPMLQLMGECGNAIEAIRILQQDAVDLVFLDIRMPQLNGNELLKVVKNLPPVILTTAHSEYALEGYDLDVVDYLLKPIRFDRFVKAVNKIIQLNGHRSIETHIPADEEKKESFVYFRSDRKMIKVLLNDILYIESMKDYVKVFTTHGMLMTKQSITSVEAMLPESGFIRAHRSYIVSIKKINSFTNEVIGINKAEIPIGKLFRNQVMKMLEG